MNEGMNLVRIIGFVSGSISISIIHFTTMSNKTPMAAPPAASNTAAKKEVRVYCDGASLLASSSSLLCGRGGSLPPFTCSFIHSFINAIGIFDLLHYGHMNVFKEAKKEGTYLIVGVCSDADATPYKRIPVMSQKERADTVRGCKFVDEVIEGCPMVPNREFMAKYKIDLIVHGDDFNTEKARLYYADAMDDGKFRFIKYTPSVSTTDILKRIKQRGYLDKL